MDKNNKRPRYLNLLKIKMPVTAVLSIAHRASGLLMVLIIPFAIYVFQQSVSSEQGFNSVIQLFQQTWVSVILIIPHLQARRRLFNAASRRTNQRNVKTTTDVCVNDQSYS